MVCSLSATPLWGRAWYSQPVTATSGKATMETRWQQLRQSKLLLWVCLGAVGLGLLMPLVLLLPRRNASTPPESREEHQALVTTVIGSMDRQTLIGDSPTKGNTNAEVVLFKFSDFQCPYCAVLNFIMSLRQRRIQQSMVRLAHPSIPSSFAERRRFEGCSGDRAVAEPRGAQGPSWVITLGGACVKMCLHTRRTGVAHESRMSGSARKALPGAQRYGAAVRAAGGLGGDRTPGP